MNALVRPGIQETISPGSEFILDDLAPQVSHCVRIVRRDHVERELESGILNEELIPVKINLVVHGDLKVQEVLIASSILKCSGCWCSGPKSGSVGPSGQGDENVVPVLRIPLLVKNLPVPLFPGVDNFDLNKVVG